MNSLIMSNNDLTRYHPNKVIESCLSINSLGIRFVMNDICNPKNIVKVELDKPYYFEINEVISTTNNTLVTANLYATGISNDFDFRQLIGKDIVLIDDPELIVTLQKRHSIIRRKI